MERGHLRGMSVGTIEKIIAALDAVVDVTARWQGAELDRTMDAAHATLQEQVGAELRAAGWSVRVEVSFNQYGDRGRIDLLAHHPVARTVVVVEVKSALGDIQDALGRLDVKVRLGRAIARDAGWTDVGAIVAMLAVADTRSVRRVIARHRTLFERFGVRGRQARAWLRRPTAPAPAGLLWYVNAPDSRQVTVTRANRVRTAISPR